MKVLKSEILTGGRGSLDGGVVRFETEEDIFKGSVVALFFKDRDQFYKVEEISTIDANTVQVAAVEYGYWANYPSRSNKFDVRGLLGLSLEIITDAVELKQLQNSDNFC